MVSLDLLYSFSVLTMRTISFLCKSGCKWMQVGRLSYCTIGHLNDYQNPSRFAFLVLIRAIVISTPVGLQNLNRKRKTN